MKRWAWIVPVLSAAAVYAPALNGELVWDDGIVRDRQMVAFHSVSDAFFPPAGIPQWADSYYRPVIVLSYMLEETLYGRESTVGPHATVIFCHVVTTLFVWLFSRQVLYRYRYREWAALVGGVIFAVHPIHTETVCWITGRSDTLAAMFLMPSVVFALHYRDRRSIWALVLAPLLFFCALGSKEVAVGGLAALPLLFLLVPRNEPSIGDAQAPDGPPKRAGFLHWLPLAGLYLLATVIYFELRSKAGIGFGHWVQVDIGDKAVRLAGALAYYLWKVFVPAPQCALVASTPGVGYGVAAVTAIVVLLGVSLWLWRRGNPVALIALLWFGLTLLPTLPLALQTTAEQVVAERALYLPSIGLSLIVGAIVAAALSRPTVRWPAVGVAAVVAAAYAYGTVARVHVWHDSLSLWTDTAAKATDTGLPSYSLGMEYWRNKQPEKALPAFGRALELHTLYDDREGRWLTHNSIGAVLMGLRRFDEAETAFVESLQINPRYPTPYYNLGRICDQRARQVHEQTGTPDLSILKKAHGYYTAAIQYNPNYVKARFQLVLLERMMAIVYLRETQDRQRAVELLRSARQGAQELLALDPNGPFAQNTAALLQTIDAALQQLPP